MKEILHGLFLLPWRFAFGHAVKACQAFYPTDAQAEDGAKAHPDKDAEVPLMKGIGWALHRVADAFYIDCSTCLFWRGAAFGGVLGILVTGLACALLRLK
ncbi:hypothetical protein [Dyella sp.]|uniref:hypothetical protein n=1 Tax=Dyella sp. TaxID=1869338 RepID=UPI002FD94DFA